MYSPAVLDHLENPRNVGEFADPSGIGEATNPVCGDLLILQIHVVDSKITEARFRAQACPPCIAAGSLLTELLTALPLEEAARLAAADIGSRLAPLPRNKAHCAVLALDSLKAALRDFELRSRN